MIKNFSKSGEVLRDLSGHVVRMDDCPAVYTFLDLIHKKEAQGDVSTQAG